MCASETSKPTLVTHFLLIGHTYLNKVTSLNVALLVEWWSACGSQRTLGKGSFLPLPCVLQETEGYRAWWQVLLSA